MTVGAKTNHIIVAADNLGASFSKKVKIGEPNYVRCTLFIAIRRDTSVPGEADVAPTDSPLGTFRVWASPEEVERWDIEDAHVALDEASPAGDNAVIREAVVLHGVPGSFVWVDYTRTSGGGTNTKCDITLEVS
jgi:hypothetical protein